MERLQAGSLALGCAVMLAMVSCDAGTPSPDGGNTTTPTCSITAYVAFTTTPSMAVTGTGIVTCSSAEISISVCLFSKNTSDSSYPTTVLICQTQSASGQNSVTQTTAVGPGASTRTYRTTVTATVNGIASAVQNSSTVNAP